VRTAAIIGTRGYPSYYGGFETAVRKLSPYLAEHGWRVVVYGRNGAVETLDTLADPRIESVSTYGIDSKSLSTLSYGAARGSTDNECRQRLLVTDPSFAPDTNGHER
jgi:hypothetical protein